MQGMGGDGVGGWALGGERDQQWVPSLIIWVMAQKG